VGWRALRRLSYAVVLSSLLISIREIITLLSTTTMIEVDSTEVTWTTHAL